MLHCFHYVGKYLLTTGLFKLTGLHFSVILLLPENPARRDTGQRRVLSKTSKKCISKFFCFYILASSLRNSSYSKMGMAIILLRYMYIIT